MECKEPTLLCEGFLKENMNIKPIDHIMNTIFKISREGKILILKSSTGSGKSSILPVYLYKQYPQKKVLVLQPRIFTTMELAKNLTVFAPIKNFPPLQLGVNVGYHTGSFYRNIDNGVMFMTFGSYQNLLETDEQICENYNNIIIDEAHEMDLMSSFIYQKLKTFIERNRGKPNCPNIIFTSATLEAKRFSKYFNNAPIVKVSGRSFPVETKYLKYDTDNFINAGIELIEKIHAEDESGDILIFVPSIAEINIMKKILAKKKFKKSLLVLPLYRNLILAGGENFQMIKKSAKELKVFRKLIIATNVGETGITYTNLKHVIDTGLYKSTEYMPDFNAEITYYKTISRLSYKQRMGRVGRTSPGIYYGLYSEETLNIIKKIINNTMYKTDISLLILKLIVEEKVNIQKIDLLYNPAYHSVWRSIEKLYLLGFITSNFQPTKLGLMGAKMINLSIEQIKIIFSAYVWKVSVPDIILVALSLSQKFTYKKTIFATEAQCDFIPIIEEYYTNGPNGVLGESFGIITDLKNAIMDSLAVVGLDPFAHHEEGFPNEDENYVKKIKQCLYEGLKLNSAYWDGTKYITQSGLELYNKFPCHVNEFVYGSIIFKKNNDKIDKHINGYSILDNFINYTPDFF